MMKDVAGFFVSVLQVPFVFIGFLWAFIDGAIAAGYETAVEAANWMYGDE